MFNTFRNLCLVMLLALLIPTAPAWSATVDYEGYVFDASGSPLSNGFAIAGTFDSAFDPYEYKCFYTDDGNCNLETTHYSEAVLDGNFLPIGTGTLTDGSGYFSGTGTTFESGAPIFLFVFNYADPDAANDFALATSSDSSYLVPTGSGSTAVSASLVNSFVFGSSFQGGIRLNGGLPIPEPTSCTLAILAVVALLVGSRKRRA